MEKAVDDEGPADRTWTREKGSALGETLLKKKEKKRRRDMTRTADLLRLRDTKWIYIAGRERPRNEVRHLVVRPRRADVRVLEPGERA